MNDEVNSPQESSPKKRRVPLPQTKIQFTCCDDCGSHAFQSLRNMGFKGYMTCPHNLILRGTKEQVINALIVDGWRLNTEATQACFEVVEV